MTWITVAQTNAFVGERLFTILLILTTVVMVVTLVGVMGLCHALIKKLKSSNGRNVAGGNIVDVGKLDLTVLRPEPTDTDNDVSDGSAA